MKQTIDNVLDALETYAHGKGFDGDWDVKELKNGKYLAKIDYHVLDENGYYDGWYTINPVTLDTNISYYRRKYLYDRDYLYETVSGALDRLKWAVGNRVKYAGSIGTITEHSIYETNVRVKFDNLDYMMLMPKYQLEVIA